jgi:Fur family ferric uptake transcriptional regulator
LRPTRQRLAVLGALADADGFRGAQAIHASMRAAGERVGLATVYRALQALADAGELDVLRDDTGELLYRRCAGGGHHHHLVCRGCGTTVEIESSAVERWAASVGEPHGFSAVEHSVEVFGTCRSCAKASRPPGA